MPYNKEETDAYVKKYCVVWYCLQIGFVGLLAVIVIFSVVLQVHRGDDLTRMESLVAKQESNEIQNKPLQSLIDEMLISKMQNEKKDSELIDSFTPFKGGLATDSINNHLRESRNLSDDAEKSKELSRNRDIPLSSQEKLKLNLNGAVELIKEDKHSENGKSMKKTKRDE